MTFYETLTRWRATSYTGERLRKIVEGSKNLWVVCGILLISCVLVLALSTLAEQNPKVLVISKRFQNSPASEFRGLARPDCSSRSPPPSTKRCYNLWVDDSAKYTSTLLRLLTLNATSIVSSSGSSCSGATTNTTKLEGLPHPTPDGKFLFKTDVLHRLNLVAFGEDGVRRCAGGDYYEMDLHDRGNLRYRSRLPTVDLGNGSYRLELVVPSQFAGAFTLNVWLLFGNFHGLDHKTEAWVRTKLMLTQELELVDGVDRNHHDNETHRHYLGSHVAVDQNRVDDCAAVAIGMKKNLKECTQSDFDLNSWNGRWTRSWFNESCQADGEKRFRCLPEERYWCEEPWCFGPLGRLESNGWQYSAHCSFRIFQREEAWSCLDGRWVLIWGDSNFQDTIRNLLLFILDWKLPRGKKMADFQLERSYETVFVNSHHREQAFRVSQYFNGANPPWIYGAGLNTLQHEIHQQNLLSYFNGTKWPDTIIMNSGLHDGDQFDTIEDYVTSADFAIEWWEQLYNSIQADKRPQLIWRATIAPAGISRKMNANPNKMEMFNQIMAEKLQEVRDKLPVKIVDAFDLSFPFHYDNEYSDGGHYGRSPGYPRPPWEGRPHWYFVDIMLAHILLNAACPSTSLGINTTSLTS